MPKTKVLVLTCIGVLGLSTACSERAAVFSIHSKPLSSSAPAPISQPAPVVGASFSVETPYQTPVVIDFQARGVQGAQVIEVTQAPANGGMSQEGLAPLELRYTPAAGYLGPDSLRYRVRGAVEPWSEEHVVSIQVLPVIVVGPNQRCGVIERQIRRGLADNFASSGSDGPPAPLLAGATPLATYFRDNPLTSNAVNGWAPYDQSSQNQDFLEVIEGLTEPGHRICGATLRLNLKAIEGAPGSDYMGILRQRIGMQPEFIWSQGLTQIFPNGWLTGGAPAEVILDLKSLPSPQAGGARINLIPELVATGSLAFYLMDDTAVDYLELTVHFEPVTTSN